MRYDLLRTQRLRADHISGPLFSDVWLDVRAGEVTGVIGLDADGKAALTAILSGRQQADDGTIYLQGDRLDPKQAMVRLKKKASYVGPDEVLANQLSIADNLFVLGRPMHGKGIQSFFVDDWENELRALEYLELAKLSVPPNTPVGALNDDERHRLEFLRALISQTPLIIFNCPLKRGELVSDEMAFQTLLDYARGCGIGVVMMFNNVDRLIRLCDRAVLVRNGRTVCLCEKKEMDRIKMMRILDGSQPFFPASRIRPTFGTAVLDIQQAVTADGYCNGFSFCLHQGEIAGIVCADDGWNSWFVDLLQGKYVLDGGRILRNGKPASSALLQKMCTQENRAFFIIGSEHLGLLQHMTAVDNLLAPIHSRIGLPFQLISSDVREFAKRICVENGIVSDLQSINEPIASFPLEKKMRIWMERARLYRPDLCVLFGMQQEIDPMMRQLIRDFTQELAAEGAGVLMLSTQKWPMQAEADTLVFVENGKVKRKIESSSPLFE